MTEAAWDLCRDTMALVNLFRGVEAVNFKRRPLFAGVCRRRVTVLQGRKGGTLSSLWGKSSSVLPAAWH